MDGFIGEIRAFCFNYEPMYWIPCDGTQYAINQYQALFAVINNQYGGNSSQENFKVPDLRGMVVMGTCVSTVSGTNYIGGSTGGAEMVGLVANNLPNHSHGMNAGITVTTPLTVETKVATTSSFLSNIGAPVGNKFGFGYTDVSNPSTDKALAINSVLPTGGTDKHNNMAPYLPLNYYICVQGTYASRD